MVQFSAELAYSLRVEMAYFLTPEHTVWHHLANGECYREAGADFFALKDPDRAQRNAVRRLQELGFEVELTARKAAWLT